ncbi:MAG: hypothetical protein PVH00_13750 [Gemmatimonadota bacterium]|jgi:hypothetical protein
MYKRKPWFILAVATTVMAAAGCRGEPDRSPLRQDELDRDLKLALEGDSAPATFKDTAMAPTPPPADVPVSKPAPPRPQPTPPPARERTEPPPLPEPEPATPPAPVMVTSTVGIGTTLSVTLDQALSTETNQAGDGFTATLEEPVYASDGALLFPAGATVRGRVVQVQKSGRIGETAMLNLAFEAISVGDRSYPLEASVVSANPERVSRQSGGETAGKVAVGAAAGAILGRVLGGSGKSTVKGAVVGAAAGTAIAMGTADVDAVLRQGSVMVIKVDAPIEVTYERGGGDG